MSNTHSNAAAPNDTGQTHGGNSEPSNATERPRNNPPSNANSQPSNANGQSQGGDGLALLNLLKGITPEQIAGIVASVGGTLGGTDDPNKEKTLPQQFQPLLKVLIPLAVGVAGYITSKHISGKEHEKKIKAFQEEINILIEERDKAEKKCKKLKKHLKSLAGNAGGQFGQSAFTSLK